MEDSINLKFPPIMRKATYLEDLASSKSECSPFQIPLIVMRYSRECDFGQNLDEIYKMSTRLGELHLHH